MMCSMPLNPFSYWRFFSSLNRISRGHKRFLSPNSFSSPRIPISGNEHFMNYSYFNRLCKFQSLKSTRSITAGIFNWHLGKKNIILRMNILSSSFHCKDTINLKLDPSLNAADNLLLLLQLKIPLVSLSLASKL